MSDGGQQRVPSRFLQDIPKGEEVQPWLLKTETHGIMEKLA
jgi:hypothetical protein